MRCIPVLMAALLLGVLPASADESASYPVEAPKPATHVVKRKTAVKPATPKVAAAAPKTVTAAPVRLPPVKPAAIKPEEKKTAAIEPAAKPIEAKPTDGKAAVAKPEVKSETPSDVFAGISQGDRLKIQSALLWSGDYTGSTNGEDPMAVAIKNFQKRSKGSITGTLTPAERERLIAAAREHEQDVGWTVVLDPATGIRMGLPTKMVPQAHEAARGTRWSSAQGQVQVETFRITGSNIKLSDVFEQTKKEPAGRQIEYSVLRDDSFIVSGMQGLKRFSVRASIRNGEVRGFTMLFDQMMETIVSPVMVAMASAFTPFPERSAPFAALSKSVEYGNGLVVSAQGHIVTDRKLTEGCQVLVASGVGDAARIADDKDSGLALLRVYAPRKLSPVALSADAPKAGDLTLVGIPDPKEQDGGRKLTEIKARLTDGSAIELRQPVPMAGFSGAAALDAQGRVLGMTEMRNAVLASIEPAAPPVHLINGTTIRAFLEANSVPVPTEPSDAKAGVVRMICVRK
jgi:hypothetical protein